MNLPLDVSTTSLALGSAIVVAGVLPLLRTIPAHYLFIVTVIKILIPVVYFSFFFQKSQWVLLDDIMYFKQGEFLIRSGYDPLSFFFNDGIIKLIGFTGSTHFLYGWINFLSHWLIGVHYYSPVFINVLATFYAAFFIMKIAEKFQFERKYCISLFIFSALHWDVVSWSSFVNLKDSIMIVLTAAMFYFIICLNNKFTIRYTVFLTCVVFLFFAIRFYVPILAMMAFVASAMIQIGGSSKRLKYILFMCALIALLVIQYDPARIAKSAEFLSFSPVSVAYGIVRMLLTPLPANLVPSYTYLLIAAILHLVFFVPMILGGVMLACRSKSFWMLLIYFCAAIVLYGSFEGQQGPRYRVQLVPIIALMQFHFIWVFLQVTVYPRLDLYRLRRSRAGGAQLQAGA